MENWRDHLTDSERELLDKADTLKAEWLLANAVRAGIVNRAIHRARYAASKRKLDAAE